MAARARLVKAETFRNEDLAELPLLARYLFIGLWTIADRKGRLEDRPRRIKADLFPYEDGLDVDGSLWQLHAAGFIQRYEVDGQHLIEIPKFLKHQKPHKRETESTLPGLGSPKASLRSATAAPRLPVYGDGSGDGSGSGEKDSCGQASLAPPADVVLTKAALEADQTEAKFAEATKSPAATVFLCKGGKVRTITEAEVARWSESHPGIDVRGEVLKARDWLEANPGKRKTVGGCSAFMVRWLNKARPGNCSAADPPELVEYRHGVDPDPYEAQAKEFARVR